MASRTKRVSILAFSNILIFAVQFFAPIVLVRILDQETYGEYRDFIIISSLIGAFIDFYIKQNLLYFIAKNPQKEKEYISNTIILKFGFIVVGLLIVYLGQDYIINTSSQRLLLPLLVYLFFIQNFDFLTIYWLAKKKSEYVFYYSFSYSIIRLIVVVSVSYYSGNIQDIIYSLLVFEGLRFLFGLVYTFYAKLFVFKIDKKLLKEQLVYIVPLGVSTVIVTFNSEISKLVISANLGVATLAIYAVASQNLPFVSIIRSSISDVIFPDVVEGIEDNPLEALNLWKRSVTLYIFFMAPIFVIFFYYAELVITTLFTMEYIEATPIFQVYLFLIVYHCFDMGVPIRGMNKNKLLLYGHIISLFINIILLYILFNLLGLIGPPIAFVVTEILLTIYFGHKVLGLYNIKLKEIFDWDEIIKLILISVLPLFILFAGEYLNINEIIKAIIFSSLYFVIYYFLVRRFNKGYLNTFIDKIENNILAKFKSAN